jgi:hypothetical protein
MSGPIKFMILAIVTGIKHLRSVCFAKIPKAQVQGAISILAELGWPTTYPGPDSRVTTTLYAWAMTPALGSGNVLIRIAPKPDCPMKAGDTT